MHNPINTGGFLFKPLPAVSPNTPFSPFFLKIKYNLARSYLASKGKILVSDVAAASLVDKVE